MNNVNTSVSVILQILRVGFVVIEKTDVRIRWDDGISSFDIDGRLMSSFAQRIVFRPFIRIYFWKKKKITYHFNSFLRFKKKFTIVIKVNVVNRFHHRCVESG